MLEFRRFISDIAPLRALIDRLADFEVVQGALVEIDPIWIECWRMNRLLGSHGAAEHWLPYRMLPYRDWFEYYLGYRQAPVFETNPAFDFSWRPDFWMEARHEFWAKGIRDELPPILVRVSMKADQADDREQRAAVTSVLRESGVPALLVDRARARLALASGDGANGAGGPGTIGGFLREKTSRGDLFAVTCGHVAGPVGTTIRDSVGLVIGVCSQSRMPLANSAGHICKRTNVNATINTIDAALIKIRAEPTLPALAGWTNHFAFSQAVSMKGRQRRVGATGAVAPFYRMIDEQQKEFCFENLFEVRTATTRLPIDPRLAQLFQMPPQPGDSGSWIEVNGPQGSQWCGMLVGVDGEMGYAIEAEAVINWARDEHGLDLYVP
jgi:hypothetical protein